METLSKIQKTVKVFKGLSLAAMILAFVMGLLLLTGIGIWYGVNEAGVLDKSDFSFAELIGYNENIAVIWCDFVLVITDGILFAYVHRYLKHELEDGTPFTERGATEIKKLGIRTIVLPIVAASICGIICGCYKVAPPENISNETSIVFGIAFIIISMVFRYGAEISKNGEAEI
ncbi:MAG: hypothetical protein ACI4KG_02840 [Oscillospiraceae bacterium]